MQGYLPNKVLLKMLEMLDLYQDIRSNQEAAGTDYHTMRYTMPIQRVFHKTRLAKFRTLEFEDAKCEFSAL